MVKNVKIDDETHRQLSILAAKLPAKKSDLCSVLVRAGIEKLEEEEVKKLLEVYVPEDED